MKVLSFVSVILCSLQVYACSSSERILVCVQYWFVFNSMGYVRVDI